MIKFLHYLNFLNPFCSYRVLILSLLFAMTAPNESLAQGKLCTWVRTTVTDVGHDYFCGDGFCVATLIFCCDNPPVEIGCVPNPFVDITGGPGGGIDPRYNLQMRTLGPAGNGGWSGRNVYQLNNRGGSGCGNQGYTATFNNPDFSQQFDNVCVSDLEIYHEFWEEDACGPQNTFNQGCGIGLGFEDDDYLLEGYTTRPISTWANGSANYYLDRGIYEWWYTVAWDIANAPGVSSANLNVCVGASPVFNITTNPDAGGVFSILTNENLLSTQVVTATGAGNITLPAHNSVGLFTYRLVEKNNTNVQTSYCRGAVTTLTVNVVADPTTPTVTRSPVDGTVCVGQTLSVTAPSSSGGTGTCNFEYRYSTNGGGTYTAWSTTVPSFAAVAGASNIIETRRNCNGLACDISGTNSQSWTVVADPTVSITGNQTICTGGSITLGTTVSGGTGTCSLQWQTWNGSAWVNISGAINSTYLTPALTAPTQYQVVRTCTGLGCGSVTSTPITVNVVADPAISITTGNQTICSGGVLTLNTTTSGGTGTCSYQWQVWNGSAFVNIPGAVNDSYTTPTLTALSYYQVIRTCSGGGCTNAVAPFVTITVVGDPTPPTVTKIPNVVQVCAGQVLSASEISSGGTGTCTVEYRYSTNNGGAWTAWSTTVPSFAAVTGTNLLEVRRSCTGIGCDVAVTQVSWDVVADPPAPTATQSPATNVCAGQILTLISPVGSGGSGTCQFEYQFSTNGGSTYSGWSTTVPSFAAVGTDNRIQIRRNCNGSGCDISLATTYIWSVAADPTIPVVTRSPNVATVCAGQTLSVTGPSSTGGTGTCNFEYRYSTNAGGTFTAWSTTVPSFAATGTENWIQTRMNCNGLGCDISPINTQIWLINPDPVMLSIVASPNTSPVCEGTLLSVTSPTGSGGTGTCVFEYQFSINGGSTYSGWSTTVPSFTATGTDNRIQVRRNCDGNSCDISAPLTIVFTVVSDPAAPTATQMPSGDVCAGQMLTLTGAGGTGGFGICLIEYRFSTNGGLGYSAWTSTVPNFAATGTDNRIQIRRNCNGTGCDISPETTYIWNIFADPTTPVVTRSPIDGTVCEGQILTVNSPTSTGGIGTCNFEYRFSTNGGANYSAWSTTVPSFAAVAGSSNIIHTRMNCNGSGCDISPINQQVWGVAIDPPTPTVTPSPNVATVCVGQALTVTSPSSLGGTGTCVFEYRFSINGGSTYSAWSTTVPNFAASGTDNRIQTRKNCNGSGCDISSPHTQIWTVVADPLISASGSTTICSGGTALLGSSTSGGTGTCTYQWLSSPDNTTYTPIVGATSATYTTPALTTQTYYRVQRICDGSDCQTATSNALTISIGVGGTSSITDTICANATYTLPSGLVVLGPGLYSDTIPGAQCDSIISINLITPPSSTHYGLYAADFTSYNQINPLTGALINSYATTPGSSGWVNGAFTMHEQAARAYWISETKQLNSLNLTNGAQTAIACAIGSMSYFWGLRYYDGYLYTITTSGDNDKVLVRFNPTTGALDGGFSIEINGSAAYEILIHSSPVIDPINGRFYINLYGNRMLGFDIGSGTGNLITLGGYVSPSGFIGLLEINEQTGEMFALSGFSDIVEIAITGATTATVSLVKTLGSGSGFSNPISAFDSDNNLYIFQAESGCATQNPLIAVDVTTGQEWCTNPPGIAFTQLEYLNCKPSSTLREIQPFDVKFFPNPVRGELTLELELEEENVVIVNIYNISGGNQSEQQFNGEAGNNRFSLDFSSLTNGIYIIQVQSGKHRFAGKVIKL
jgi:hypothetical protein